MADDQATGANAGTPAAAATASDPIQNLKAEFTRKLDNQTSELAKLTQLLQTKLQPTNHKTGAPATNDPALSDVWYSDQDKAAEIIEKRAEARILGRFDAHNQDMAARQAVANQIYQDYPEAQDVSHPLTVKANEIYKNYSEDERRSPSAMKLAVKEAALELGVRPKSKRDADSATVDSFSLRSSGYQAPRREEGLSKESLEVAKNFGFNTDDPKVLERLKARQKNIKF